MSSLNKTMLIGRLGQDPEVRYSQSNTAIANFSLATSEKYKNKQGEQIENTEWHRCVSFGRLAEIIQEYVSKGSLIYVEGPLQTREWTDKNDQKRYTTEVKVLSMHMLGNAKEFGNRSEKRGSSTAEVSDGFDDMDDDLPF